MIIDPYRFATAPADTAFVTGVTLGSFPDRNNFEGFVGFYIDVGGAAVTVTQLGRWVQSGNSQVHYLAIVEDGSGNVLAHVYVDTNGAPANAFLYGTLASPYVLSASTRYFIFSYEYNGGDIWANNTDTVITHTAIGTVESAYSYYLNPPQPAGGTDWSYVPNSFKYHL